MPRSPEWLRAAQDSWTNRGDQRPPFALPTAAGEESVWDYPRPPAIVADARRVQVTNASGAVIADTTKAVRILETASPPTFYLPTADIDTDLLVPVPGSSFCEWKGEAAYQALRDDPAATPVAWGYASPYDNFAALLDHLAFYPGRVVCSIDGETVRPQAGGFYGGWITDEVIGPYKGDPGTGGW